MKMRFVLSVKYILYLAFSLLCIIAIIHTAVTAKFTMDNYGAYLSQCYVARFTPGGVVVGLLTYPLMSLLNVASSYVFFGIVLTILIALIIDYLYAVKQFSKLNAPMVINKEPDTPEVTIQEASENKKTSNFDFVFESKNQPQDVVAEQKPQEDDSIILAKKRLGLVKDDDFDIIIPSQKKEPLTPAQQLFGTKTTEADRWLNKDIIKPIESEKPPKVVYDEKKDNLKKFLNATGNINEINTAPIISSDNYDAENHGISPVVQNIEKLKLVMEDGVVEEKKNVEDIPVGIQSPNPVKDEELKIQNSLNKNISIGKKQDNGYQQMQIIGTEKAKSKNPTFISLSNYKKPPISLLKEAPPKSDTFDDEQIQKSEIIERVLDEFKIPVQVQAVRRGAAVTRYELKMPVGIPVKKIHNHCEDIELALASKGGIRIETPIRGKSAVGIEVPNDSIDVVALREVVESSEFTENKDPLTFALGKDVDGTIYTSSLANMPHLLVAGSTNSGKSVCLNALLISLIYRYSPEDLRIMLIDPKRVEFTAYNDLPHLIMPKVITDAQKAINAFDWLINEMERRFNVFQDSCVNKISAYNALPEIVDGKEPKMPYIVMVVDELADLMATGNKKELENKIVRLVQKSRAAGIHLVLATQRPSVDVITGTIKTNLPSRIAFAVTNFVDSKTILDQAGAEKLLGRGDMLYSPNNVEPIRIQGAFVSNKEIRDVVEFIKENNSTNYDDAISNAIEKTQQDSLNNGSSAQEMDSLMPECLKLIIETGQATISFLQRRFSLGFSRAARIIDQMEMAKYISPSEGGKPRSVYITMEEYNKIYGGNNEE